MYDHIKIPGGISERDCQTYLPLLETTKIEEFCEFYISQHTSFTTNRMCRDYILQYLKQYAGTPYSIVTSISAKIRIWMKKSEYPFVKLGKKRFQSPIIAVKMANI